MDIVTTSANSLCPYTMGRRHITIYTKIGNSKKLMIIFPTLGDMSGHVTSEIYTGISLCDESVHCKF